MDSLTIELMNKNNIEAVREISSLSFSVPWTLESIEKELENNLAKYILLKSVDKYIGFVGVWIIFDEGHITNIAIHPEYRGFGYSKILMDALIDTCKKNNVNSITLEVRSSNIPAIKLYEKYGFIVEGIRKDYYDKPKEDGFIMWKRNL